MKYRLIAADMDGTLLTDDKRITDRTADAVRRAGEAGVFFCLSTGRPLGGVRRYIEQLGLTTPAITYNGAVIVDPVTGAFIYEQGLEPEAAKEIWQLGMEFDTTIIVWSKERLLVNRIDDRVEKYKLISGVEPVIIDGVDCLAADGITKMLWYDEIDRINGLQDILPSRLTCPANFATSNPRFLEFFDHRVSKAAAMERLGEYLGVSREEMIAIGDGWNDLPMLRYAGLGVAMANAPDEIRAQCGHVTASNEEDGVALAIEKLILNG